MRLLLLSGWRLRPYRIHCLHGWWSHLVWQWNPTLTGLWWLSHQCTLWDPVVTVFLNEKLDLWLWVHFASWPLSACSALILRFSGRIECLIVVPKMVWVPFPSLISFTGQLATQDLPRPSLHLFVSFTDFLMFFLYFQQYWSNALTSSTLCLVCTSFCLVYIVSATGNNVKEATRQLFLFSSLVRSELRWQLTPQGAQIWRGKSTFLY